MKQKIFSFIFLLMSMVGCEKETDTNGIDKIDQSPPIINIADIGDSLEEFTTITINIGDDSPSVTTKVSINKSQVLETTQKQFTFEIDPFSLPSGTTTLVIRTEDGNNNQSEISRTFELSKLLIKIAENQPRINSDSQEVFYAVNTMEGALLGYSEVVNRGETVKIYAPDNFDFQPIILTSYLLSSSIGPALTATSFSNIVPGTNFHPFQENVGQRTENNAFEIDSGLGNNAFFDFSITGIPFEPDELAFVGFGSRYGINNGSTVTPNGASFDFSLNFGYRSEFAKEVVITNGIFENLNELVEFEYFQILELENQSISYLDLKKPDNFISVQIPETISSGSTIRLDGIRENSDSQYDDFYFLLNSTFDLNGTPGNVVSNISIPEINGFDGLRFTAQLNLADRGKELISSTIGIEDIAIPAWDATLIGNEVNTTGGFDLISIETESNSNNFVLEESFKWTYFTHNQNEIQVPFSLIEIPEAVLQNPKFPNVEQSSMSTTGNMTVILESFSEKPTYVQSLFRNDFQKGREGNELSLRIPLQN
jgi:hypothetical protein